jgi:ferredoxin
MTYTVTIQSTGVRFIVESGETVLQAGLRQGVTLPYGCHGGMCGVCISRIIQGRLIYPNGLPLALADDETMKNNGLSCVGIPASDLVIEPINAGQDWEPWE